MARTIDARYSDPLDLLWIEAARKMGLRVLRSGETYASTDGQGTLYLSAAESMDPDDCLAQMILHEICHWMVQGPQSIGWVDWGLDNEGSEDVEREHACLRLQAVLLDEMGLRRALGPTTEFRNFYDALDEDPFAERHSSERESILRARAAFARREQPPFRGHLRAALVNTADLLGILRRSMDPAFHQDEILSRAEDALPKHAVGLPSYPTPRHTCGDCAWIFARGKRSYCRQAHGQRTESDAPSCAHYERAFDCLSCGACCREAYDTVEVAPRDKARKLHLPLLIARNGGFDLARNGSRCCCLRGGVALPAPRPKISGGHASPEAGANLPPLVMPNTESFTCSIYETRPKTCRDFSIYSEHCLYARRRVGLSR